MQHLERHVASQRGVVGAVNECESPIPQWHPNLVPTHRRRMMHHRGAPSCAFREEYTASISPPRGPTATRGANPLLGVRPRATRRMSPPMPGDVASVGDTGGEGAIEAAERFGRKRSHGL